MEHFSFHKKSSRVIMTSILIVITILTSAQSYVHSNLPQYLYPEFSSAVIKMKNGKSVASELNYNMVTGNMVFEKDGDFYDFINPGLIDTIYLQDSKFIRFGKAFYEIIYPAPIPLFLHHKGNVVPVGKEAGYGTKSQTSSITNISSMSAQNGFYNLELPPNLMVTVDKIYWINLDNNMFSFMNLKQFLKIFPGKEDELKKYIKSNHIKIDRRDDIIKLMRYCNDIINDD
jgi:hypothetical protein